jgi:hypothetical protein
MAITRYRQARSDLLNPTELVQRIELHDDGQDRRQRLFVCGCARHIDPFLTDGRSRRAIDTAEKFTDGLATFASLLHAHAEAAGALKLLSLQEGAARLSASGGERDRALEAARHAARVAWLATLPEPIGTAATRIAADHVRQTLLWLDEDASFDLEELHDDLTPPADVGLDPAWLQWNDATVYRLALRIDAERRYADLPILADALEEAGCGLADFLGHCRGHGPHIKGCWVVDLILTTDRAVKSR